MDTLALIQQWRAACAQHGIDPVEGATGYQIANMQGERAKATHASRMGELVMRHAAYHPANYDNGYGLADSIKVKRQSSRVWWVYPQYWRARRFDGTTIWRPTEYAAVKAMHTYAREAVGEHGERLIVAIRTIWRDERERLLAEGVIPGGIEYRSEYAEVGK